MASTLFQDIFTSVDVALATHVVTSSTNLIKLLVPIFDSMLIIWITIWGYMAMMGRIDGVLSESFYRILRIVFILTLGLSTVYYNGIIVPFLQQGPEAIVQAIMGTPSASMAVNLDKVTTSVFDSGIAAWNRGGLSNMSQLIIALMIFGFGGVLVILLGSMILMAKVMLTLLLAIGPLFIIATLFQSTQKFFDSWIGVLMNAAFILILAASLGSVFLTVADTFASSRANPSMSDAFAIFILFSMFIFVVKHIPGIAAALGGGFALSAQGAIRGMVDKIKGGGRMANQLDKMPQKTRNSVNNLKKDYNDKNRVSTRMAKGGVYAYQKTFRRNSISGS